MPKIRVHNFSRSLDGFAAGPDQSVDDPIGVGGRRLHEWVFRTRTGRRMLGVDEAAMDDGDETIDDEFMTQGDAGIEVALERARDAANGNDVRIGGGVTTIQQYLRAGLIDEMHLAIVPGLLGRGERLFDQLDDVADRYECVELVGSSSVTHARVVRKPA